MYFPKKSNNILLGLVSQLNNLFGNEQCFKLITYNLQASIIYELVLTEKGLQSHLNLGILTIDIRYKYSFSDMNAYLNGLIRGIKIIKNIN